MHVYTSEFVQIGSFSDHVSTLEPKGRSFVEQPHIGAVNFVEPRSEFCTQECREEHYVSAWEPHKQALHIDNFDLLDRRLQAPYIGAAWSQFCSHESLSARDSGRGDFDTSIEQGLLPL